MNARLLRCLSALAAAAALFPVLASAQRYPAKPIEVVSPFPPGGIADISFRAIQPLMSKELGATFVVLSKPGAGGTIAIEYVRQQRSDGYTILNAGNPQFTTSLAIQKTRPYQISDFVPLGTYSFDPGIIVTRADAPWKSLKEFIAYVRANPGKVTWGDGGVGGAGHFTMEALKEAVKVDMQGTHYAGAAPQLAAVMGGHVHVVCAGVGTFIGGIRSGELRGLATTFKHPALPDVPTLAEEGLADAAFNPTQALYVTAGTPREVVDQLQRTLSRVMNELDGKQALERAKMLPIWVDGPTTTKNLNRELEQASAIATKLKIVAN
jgi:tripartite-type tricarboxylate transporter receptor subunit TctC